MRLFGQRALFRHLPVLFTLNEQERGIMARINVAERTYNALIQINVFEVFAPAQMKTPNPTGIFKMSKHLAP